MTEQEWYGFIYRRERDVVKQDVPLNHCKHYWHTIEKHFLKEYSQGNKEILGTICRFFANVCSLVTGLTKRTPPWDAWSGTKRIGSVCSFTS